ncbi:MAG: response regulator transcription factor [Solirubrobacteraceae bacterium]|nr:response regulator transcription factor [Solirubrobacteraceae bacterium]
MTVPGPIPIALPELLPDRSVRALVIDPHDLTRIGLGVLLQRQRWIGRCLLATDQQEAVALLRRHRPHVALLDVANLGPFIAPAVAALRAAHPAVQVILSSRCQRTAPISAKGYGATTFLPADAGAADVVGAIRAALVGERAPTQTPAASLGAQTLGLTAREREVLELLGTGATNREIAARLHLGPDSVKKHATAVYRKLGVRNRTEAAQRAATLFAAA